MGPSQAAIVTNLQPIIGIMLAPMVLGERIGIWHVVGTLFVLAGVGLTTRVYAAKPGEEPARASQPKPARDARSVDDGRT